MYDILITRYSDITEETWDCWHRACTKWQVLPALSSRTLRCAANKDNEKKLFLATVSIKGQLVAFYPFKREVALSGKVIPIIYCLPWHLWMPAGPTIDPQCTMAEKVAIWSSLFKNLPPWHKMNSGLVPIQADVGLEQFLKTQQYNFLTNASGMAEISGFETFDDFLAQQSKQWQRHYRKAQRQLARGHQYRFEHIKTMDKQALGDAIKRVMSIYSQSWKAQDRDPVNNLHMPEAFRHFQAILERFNDIDGVHVLFLVIDGKDAAFCLGIHENMQYCSLHTAYSENFKHHSAGYLTLMESFKYTIEQRYSTNNLLAIHAYKTHLTKSVSRYQTYVITNKGFVGGVLKFAKKLAANLAYIQAMLSRYIPKSSKTE